MKKTDGGYCDEKRDRFCVGGTMPAVTDDYGNALAYNFTVDALTSDYAVITFYN